ncbi:MAG TPA: hypothetical protein GX506_01030 [Firmicutes bacterium]|nr:hypothetical protein [Bacillota bacterium]
MSNDKVLPAPRVTQFRTEDGKEVTMQIKHWSKETAHRVADKVKGRLNYIVVRRPEDMEGLQARIEELARVFGSVHIVFAWDDDVDNLDELYGNIFGPDDGNE